MKVLIFSNIPSPYKIDFFNEFGKLVDLTVVFEAKTAAGIRFNWNIEQIKYFKAVFLKEGDINEKRINWSILKYIRRNYYDHIIVTSYAYYTEMIALIALKLFKIPYFLEIDGGLIRRDNILKCRFKRFLISNAKGYFSPSKSSDDYLIHYGAKGNSIFRYPFTSLKNKDILTAIVSTEEKKRLREKLGIKEEYMIITVGQFIDRKGFDVLLKASKTLNKNIGIFFIGGIATNKYIELKETYDLKNVYFEGFKTKKELSLFFKAADLFILPTREDIWGLVINEAMAYGLPVITTDKCVAGLELVTDGENGFIVPVENEDAITNKILTIFNDTNLHDEMSNNNLKKIQGFTIEYMTKCHIEILSRNFD